MADRLDGGEMARREHEQHRGHGWPLRECTRRECVNLREAHAALCAVTEERDQYQAAHTELDQLFRDADERAEKAEAELARVTEERDAWERRYYENSTHWRERALKAERELAREREAKHLLDRQCVRADTERLLAEQRAEALEKRVLEFREWCRERDWQNAHASERRIAANYFDDLCSHPVPDPVAPE